MTTDTTTSRPDGPIARSAAIVRSWRTIDWPGMFSAVIYPLLGAVGMLLAVILGLAVPGLTFHWWYPLIALPVIAGTVFICNQGIGPLHRIWQHRAGELKLPAQIIVAFNCIVAMQGKLADWVNYHSQHHALSDKPGDPHNPHESKFWAWIGWIIWRDKQDLQRPTPMWLKSIPAVQFIDRFHISLSLVIHLLVPAVIYLIVALAGGSLIFTFFIHAAAVVGRGLQFHATTLGVNVFGHLKTPKWLQIVLALLTGGEAIHGHHHEFPKSALHLPQKGFWNRIVDYNGTFLLLLSKLRLARNLEVAPQFEKPQRATA
ncbi:MAG: acyl-CoA desaturase [Maricaulaceae bacterium]|jgi:stearoyl-CoA desaturase (delta-9 desaturase)